ncbi:activator-dependent family glycosyltransferase [Actinomadura fulvescens]|uniref:DUF1205 domain-containing protein n=1 Tax=Actinomadura fulvescens TaxID=46160 RepID=A0ABN3Q690_9ACTN
MRVLFFAPPAKVHIFAQVPIAWALRAAGHEVRAANRPNMLDDITRAGLAAVPVGPSFDPGSFAAAEEREPLPWESWQEVLEFAELRPERLTYDYMHAVFAAWTLVFQGVSPPEVVNDLVRYARAWKPDLVVWDTLAFAGPVAARACGAAHARVMFGLDVIGRMRGTYLEAVRQRPAELREDPLEEWLSPVLAQHGGFDEDVVMGQWTVDPLPTSLRLEVDHHYVPMRHVPYHGPAAVPGWLLEPPKRRRVCLTLGLSVREVLGGDRVSIGSLLEAVADLDAEVVATLNDDQLAGISRLPDNVRAVDFVPLNELLPSCSAILHQGGFGTLQAATTHGVPQVILPPRAGDWDSRIWAHRVQDAGAGLSAPDSRQVTAGEVRAMLDRVLAEPSFQAGADRLRTEMVGTPAPREVVPVLERLTTRCRSL